MCPDRPPRRRHGFALMAALFIIVTLAAIATYLLTVSTGQVAAASQDEQAARAYQAARSGIDWAAYQILINSSCLASQDVPQPNNFIVQVACTAAAAETEGSRQITAYTVSATGCNAASCGTANTEATYVERRLQLTLSKCTAGC
jgi:MSHA biogenesis protein MshP